MKTKIFNGIFDFIYFISSLGVSLDLQDSLFTKHEAIISGNGDTGWERVAFQA